MATKVVPPSAGGGVLGMIGSTGLDGSSEIGLRMVSKMGILLDGIKNRQVTLYPCFDLAPHPTLGLDSPQAATT